MKTLTSIKVLQTVNISLCLFDPGYWNIIVHGRKHSYRLYTKMLNEAMRWANAIQGAIDSKVPIETPTQQLIRDIKVFPDTLCFNYIPHFILTNLICRFVLLACWLALICS